MVRLLGGGRRDVRDHPERKPTRRPRFDYTTPGAYFVTICLQEMSRLRFGEVRSERIVLTEAGELIEAEWGNNIARYPGAESDTHIVMPNHIHAIVMTGTDPNYPPANLNDIIATFKSVSTAAYGCGVRAGTVPPYDGALWQRSYYDRMIHDNATLERARAYIEGNPARWIEKFEERHP
jgi:REP element-mobilizing transposase RayT